MMKQGLPQTFPFPGRLLMAVLLALLIPVWSMAAEPSLSRLEDGLMRERDSGLIWQMERSRKMRTPAAVQHYLRQLNQGKYRDWRLPTKWELYGLFAKFDLKKNGDIAIALEGSYWLRDEDGSIHPGAWETGDQCGPERIMYPTKSGYVRAVRP